MKNLIMILAASFAFEASAQRNWQILQDTELPVIGQPSLSDNDTIMIAIDQQFDTPFRLYSTFPTVDAILNIGSNEIFEPDGATGTIAEASSTIPSYSGATINYQTGALTGGTLLVDGGAFALPACTVGQYRRHVFSYVAASNSIDTTFSAENAALGSLANAGGLLNLLDGLSIGWIDLECTNAAGEYKTANSLTNVIENDQIVRIKGNPILDIDNISPLTTKGDILSHDGTNNGRFAACPNGQLLGFDSGETFGLSCETALVDPMTTRGDIIVRDATNTTARLPVGADNRVLASDGTDVLYAQIDNTAFFAAGAEADASNRGVVSTGTQTIAGEKTLNNPLKIVHSETPDSEGIFDTFTLESTDVAFGLDDPISGIVFRNDDASLGGTNNIGGLIQLYSSNASGNIAYMDLITGGSGFQIGVDDPKPLRIRVTDTEMTAPEDGDCGVGTVCSGRNGFDCTTTGAVNLDSCNAGDATWIRVGDNATVSFFFTANATTTATDTKVIIDTFPTELTPGVWNAVDDAQGVCTVANTGTYDADRGARVSSRSDETIEVDYRALDTGNVAFFCVFNMRID